MKHFKLKSLLAGKLSLIVVLAFLLLLQNPAAQAAAAKIYLKPATATYQVGTKFNVAVRISSTQSLDAANVELLYNSNGLKVESITGGNGFPNRVKPNETKPGYIFMRRSRNRATSGNVDLQFAVITFKVIKAGSWRVKIGDRSKVINSTTGNIQYSVQNGTYTGTTPPPPPPPPPPPQH